MVAFSDAAIGEFCSGYGCMFDKDITWSQVAADNVSAEQLKKNYDGIIAVNSVDCFGPIEGRFHILFDKRALFTLAGVTVMMPPARVKENCVRGNEEDASYVADAIGEVGNILVGSFQRVFIEGVPEDAGFGNDGRITLKLPVSVGRVEIDLDDSAETFRAVTYELGVPGFDPFQIQVVFPQG